jgi:hypothetical protein
MCRDKVRSQFFELFIDSHGFVGGQCRQFNESREHEQGALKVSFTIPASSKILQASGRRLIARQKPSIHISHRGLSLISRS